MPKFRFTRIMEVKEKVLEHRQRELETALMTMRTISDHILSLDREIAFHHNDLSVRCLTGNEFSLVISHLEYLDRAKILALAEKKRAEGVVDGLRKELAALAMELKVFEKLKSKSLQAEKKKERKREQKGLDEIALRREAT